jgi:hypothetical protein
MKKNKKKCNCGVCKFSRRFSKWRDKLPKSALKFADELYERMANFEDDAGYYHAIVDGSWLDADRIIKHAREKRQETCKVRKVEKKVDGPTYTPPGLKVDGYSGKILSRPQALDKATEKAFYDGLKKIK